MTSARAKNVLLLVFVAGFIVYRAAMTLFMPPMGGEPTHQFRAGEHIRNGEGALDLWGEPDVRHPILLTALSAAFGGAFDADTLAALLFAVLGTLTAWTLFDVTNHLYGRRAAWWVWAVWAVLPALNGVLLFSVTHSLLLFCLAQTLRRFMLAAEKAQWGDYLGAGAWGGLAYLSREEGLLYFPLWFALALWTSRASLRAGAWKKFAACALVFTAFASVQVFYIHHYTGKWSFSEGAVSTALYEPSAGGTKRMETSALKGDPDSLLSLMRHNKGLFAKRIALNIEDLFSEMGGLKVFPFFLFAVVGFGLCARAPIPEYGRHHAALALSLAPTAAHFIFHIEARYLLPPVMFMLPWLCGGMARLWESFGERKGWDGRFGKTILAASLVFLCAVTWGHLLKYRATAHTECRDAGRLIKRHAASAPALLLASNEIPVFYSGLRAATAATPEEAEALVRLNRPLYMAVAEHADGVQQFQRNFGAWEGEWKAEKDFAAWKFLDTVEGRMGRVHIYIWDDATAKETEADADEVPR